MRNGQLTRVLSVYRTILAERRTLDALARDFSVTTRTIRRDLDALHDAGFAVCKSHDSDDAYDDHARCWWITR